MQYYFDAKINIDMLNLKPLHLKAVNKSQISRTRCGRTVALLFLAHLKGELF